MAILNWVVYLMYASQKVNAGDRAFSFVLTTAGYWWAALQITGFI
jgi:hypothetical protein